MSNDVPKFEVTFLDIVEALCKRPKMYTENGTFGEIVAYLDGYSKGKGLSGGYHYSFTPFRNWLEAKYAENSEERKRLNDRTDHQAALAEFARLYREYEESGSKEGK